MCHERLEASGISGEQAETLKYLFSKVMYQKWSGVNEVNNSAFP